MEAPFSHAGISTKNELIYFSPDSHVSHKDCCDYYRNNQIYSEDKCSKDRAGIFVSFQLRRFFMECKLKKEIL
jgi:hypothetical protein